MSSGLAGPGAIQARKWIAVSGSTGLVGRALVASLEKDGHRVSRLVRRSGTDASGSEITWDPAGAGLDAGLLEGVDAVVHLAGASISSGRWTDERKQLIRESRTEGTRLLCHALSRMRSPPSVLVSASAVGFYGDRGSAWVDETSGVGDGFLAEVCEAWEAMTRPAHERGIRTVHLRIGVVLSARGGALAAMLPIFRLGAGGVLGSGEQYLSWIGLADLVRVIQHAIRTDSVSGALCAVAPEPATNREFTRALGRVLHRPTWLHVPAFAIRILLGEMGRSLLLEGARVSASRIVASGFRFEQRTLDDALRAAVDAQP